MKLLLDQGLPRSAAALLRDAGIDAIHTGEIGYATAEDAVIIIRVERLRAEALTELIQRILNDWHSELTTGAVLTVQPRRIRSHRLPLLSRGE
ncbi:MAG: DUF5615 family PIN-like protein [Caldilinea sp.]